MVIFVNKFFVEFIVRVFLLDIKLIEVKGDFVVIIFIDFNKNKKKRINCKYIVTL